MNKIIIGVCIIIMLIIPSVNALYSKNALNNIKFSLVENEQGSSEEELTIKHIFPILKGYFFIEKDEIRDIIKKIVLEIISTGNATINEIEEIVISAGINVKEIYLFPDIKTTKTTDGELFCYPGNFRANLFGYNAKGSYVRYKTWFLALYGWNLEINGINVQEVGGHFVGYYGEIRCTYDTLLYPPGEYSYFNLEGNAILAFHGA
jgi:hypothetical protein